MSETTAERQQQERKITAADVANYLRENPGFFLNRPDILYDMELPHAQGSASSLLERQASVLRNRNTELRHKLNDFVSIARDNDKLFNRIRVLGLALLEAGNLAELSSRLRQVLLKEFRLDEANLFLFKSSAESGPFSVTSQSDVQAAVGGLMRGDRIICTTLRQREMTFLFPGFEHSDGSAALIPLHFNGELGLLALGSHDPNHFNSNMDTTFARYVGDILSRRLYHFLK
ncbi:MAG: DUF484 family protein [Ketobacter sp.]|jgi:uncharacterized protein|nr:DUF484 family protein [Ketobacter sp.]MEC8813338.1 DUF484 family protein [Pseudomonadota bacterium]|tara:strand:+ start:487 stop:1179 length:693 start_codon:yes stop_codon:yes gene_type:complete